CAYSLLAPQPRPTPRPLFPYTTLFRSSARAHCHRDTRSPGTASSLPSPTPTVGSSHAMVRSKVLQLPVRIRNGSGRMRQSTVTRSEEHTSELQSLAYLVCRLLLEKKTE